ncbi:MAG: nucleotidyltransferase domain-containing protein [Candidatus Nezhaarchaeales archaeon]
MSVDKGLLNIAFSRLHSLRALYLHNKTKPRLYRVIKPESFALMCAGVIKSVNAIEQERYLQLMCDVVEELVRKYHDYPVCVYGSVARGVASPESDVDILVVSNRFEGLRPREVEELCIIEGQ